MTSSGEDIGWRFGESIDGNKRKIKCKFCGKIINGGITRLKEHLAHKRGDVAPCSSVSVEVKKDMMAVLMNYKDKKRDKQRMQMEVEEELINSIRRAGEESDEDDDDPELQYVRQLSRFENEYENTRDVYRGQGSYHNAGAGSYNPTPHVTLMNRSNSVRDSYARQGRHSLTNPASRLRSREVELEKDCQKQKQPKLSTNLVKKAKKKLLKAFGNWFLDTNTAFKAIESSYTNPLMETIREVGDKCRAPSAYDLAEVILHYYEQKFTKLQLY